MIQLFLFFAATCLFLNPACGSATSEIPLHEFDDAEVAPDATLGPGDVFDVRVFGEPNLSATYRVASDGTIDYPLIGSIVVAGLTPSGVKTLIESRLVEGELLKSPQVSILVKEYSSKKISVFGQVNKPGTFPFQEGMGIVEAISLAGGFTPMARKDQTIVTREMNGEKRQFRISVEDIARGSSRNFVLRPGDIVYVLERAF
jgi:polysaccharide export outer membrane protein